MSRSCYSDEVDNWQLIKWRGQVASAIRGKRGQSFLVDIVDALDSMSEKRLIVNELENENGVCAIGSLGVKRGLYMAELDPEDCESIASVFDIAPQLVREITWLNDESDSSLSPEERWHTVRNWAVNNINKGKVK
jgi:hypothetical protein